MFLFLCGITIHFFNLNRSLQYKKDCLNFKVNEVNMVKFKKNFQSKKKKLMKLNLHVILANSTKRKI